METEEDGGIGGEKELGAKLTVSESERRVLTK